MSDLSDFYLNSKASVVQLECLEISHSAFSQVYYLVRNAVHGVTVTHEDETSHAYSYMPMKIDLAGVTADLDHVIQIVMGDLGEVAPMELDRVRADEKFDELPMVVYRSYRADDLSAPLDGPLVLEVRRFTMDRQGCAFEAKAPSLNVAGTGEAYSIARIPMLKGVR